MIYILILAEIKKNMYCWKEILFCTHLHTPICINCCLLKEFFFIICTSVVIY